MATISVTSSPVQIDDGTGVELQITNTGTADVRVGKGTTGKRGQTVRPGGFLRFEPEGSAVYAASDSASTLNVVTSTAPALTNLSATVAANTTAIAALPATYAPAARTRTQTERAPVLAKVVERFTGTGGGLAISRSGTTYSLLHGIGTGRFWKADLVQISGTAGGYLLNQMQAQSVVAPMLSKDETDASIVYAGTWSAGQTGGQAAGVVYGGTYTYSLTLASTATFTTPASVTKVGARVVKSTNGGLAKVSVDGSATAATLLPTAQSLVDSGYAASTILAANGGQFQPTDRVLDCYQSSPSYDVLVVFADNLTAGVHTVVVTATGHQAIASSAARVYLSGMLYATAATTLTTTGAVAAGLSVLSSVNSAWEYALKVLPTGATTPTFIGNIHGYDVQDTLTIVADDATITPADGATVTATRYVEVTRTSHLQHPDTGSTQVAAVVTVYRLDRFGVRIDVTVTWSVSGRLDSSYVMLPLNGAGATSGAAFTRGDLLANPAGPVSMVAAASSDVYQGQSKSAAAWMWDGRSTGLYGALVYVPDVETFTNDWANSLPLLSTIEDRNNGSGALSKVYISRNSGTSETFAAGGTYHSSARYVVGYFPDGAEAALGDFTVRAPLTQTAADLRYGTLAAQTALVASQPQTTGTFGDPVATGSITMQVANDAWLGKIIPRRSFTVTKLVWFTGSATSGNYDVAILDAAGTRLWSKGSTAWPAINTVVVETVSPGVAIVAGTPIYVVFAHDNVTGTTRGIVPSFAEQTMDDAGGKLAMRFASSFPVPSSLAVASGLSSNRVVQMYLRSA